MILESNLPPRWVTSPVIIISELFLDSTDTVGNPSSIGLLSCIDPLIPLGCSYSIITTIA